MLQFNQDPSPKTSRLMVSEESEDPGDQKDRLMRGAAFSCVLSGLHLMSGELRSISWKGNKLKSSKMKIYLKLVLSKHL